MEEEKASEGLHHLGHFPLLDFHYFLEESEEHGSVIDLRCLLVMAVVGEVLLSWIVATSVATSSSYRCGLFQWEQWWGEDKGNYDL